MNHKIEDKSIMITHSLQQKWKEWKMNKASETYEAASTTAWY